MRPISVKFSWSGLEKSLWINPGMDETELLSTLCASFGLPEDSIEAVFVADTGRSYPLSKVCENPSQFGSYKNNHIVLTEDAEDLTEYEEDDDDEEDFEEAVGEHRLNRASTSMEKKRADLTLLSQGLGLSKCSVDEVFDAFAEQAHGGTLDEKRFKQAYYSLMRRKGMPIRNVDAELQILFSIFDQDGNGIVDFEELGSGVSVLTGGSRDEKVRAAFSLYDYNNDGYITLDEMINYMSSVFKLLFASSDIEDSMGVDSDELAEITAKQCFEEADLDRDGRLTFEEFKTWYSKPSSMRQTMLPASQQPPPPALPQANASSLGAQGIDLERIRQVTGVANLDIFTVFDQFAMRVNSEGNLTWDAFRDAFVSIRDMAGIRHTSYEQSALFQGIIRRLFELFDSDHNGVVDFVELSSGMSVLAKPKTSPDEKLRAVFSLLDVNGDGFISIPEMEAMLTSIFKTQYEISPAAIARAGGLDPASLARITTLSIFQAGDLDRDQRLSFSEFVRIMASEENKALTSPLIGHRPTLNLAEVSKVSGLNNLEIEDLFDVLSEFIEPGKPGLSRLAFQRAVHALAPRNVDRSYLNVIINQLFDLFEMQNGFAPFEMLVSGLSILCKGDMFDRAEVAFNLFDLDGNGVLSPEELVVYFAGVFRLVFGADPGAAARAGVDPDTLAKITVSSIFDTFDKNNDRVLSWDEFQAWAMSNEPATAPPVAAKPSPSLARSGSSGQVESIPWMSLREVRRLTCLDQYAPEEAFEILAEMANEDGLLDKPAFFKAFHHIIGRKGGLTEEEDRDRLRLVLHRLFDTFDVDNNSYVDFSELSAGLSILCAGTDHDKAKAAFQLYDVDSDGRISKTELCRYLTCVFKVMYQTQPGTYEQTGGVSAEDLAWSTTEKVFQEADLDKDGYIDLEEFRRWYSGETGRQLSVAADLIAQDPEWFSIAEIRRLTNLDKYDSNDLLEMFANAAREDTDSKVPGSRLKRQSTSNMYISRESFDEVFQDLVNEDSCATEDDFVRLTFIMDRLYDMFDINGDGKVDFSELSVGLSTLSGGTKEKKLEDAFHLFDRNGDGLIDREEMRSLLESLYKVMFSTQPELKSKLGNVSPEDLARATADEAFALADTNHDNLISYEEYKAFFAKPTGQAFQGIVTNAPPFVSLDEVRRLTKINNFSAEDIRDQIDSFADSKGQVSRDAFTDAMREIAIEGSNGKQMTSNEEKHFVSVVHRLFDILCPDGKTSLNKGELVAGLSILTSGDKDSKARIAFDAVDYDSNGSVSIEEMERYLLSVFKLMYKCQPETAHQMGDVTPEMLAKATADSIFIEADLDGNGELSFDEFRKFYNSQTSSQGPAFREIVETVPHWLTLPEIRRLTRLEQYAPTDVFEHFARHSHDGELDRHSFEKAFRDIVMNAQGPRVGHVELDRLHLVINRLFEAFDGGHGKVEYIDLVAGLSVLCGGPQRAEAAFQLYDFNNDGFIDMTEMLSMLESIFRVMFELQPSTREKLGGASAGEVAQATCTAIFDEADLNHDGRISYAEFQKWMQSDSSMSSMFGGSNPAPRGPPPPRPPAGGEEVISVDEIKRITGLENWNQSDVFEEFAIAVDDDGTLDESRFRRVFSKLIDSSRLSAEDKKRVPQVLSRLFDIMDADGNRRIDFSELGACLSIFCKNNRDEKASVAFTMFDENGDGVVDRDEIERYLCSVFRLMFETTPNLQARAGGLSPEELAEITAEDILERYADGADELSFPQFKAWYDEEEIPGSSTQASRMGSRATSSTSSYGPPPGVIRAVPVEGQASPSWLSLDEVRRLTGLNKKDVNEVFEEIAMLTNEEGVLTRPAFEEAFSRLVGTQRLSPEDQRKLEVIRSRLFDIFDVDGNGVVDFAELASGLTVLAGSTSGNMASKIDALFALYDLNGDGFISFEELRGSLCSIFKVMLECEPEASRRISQTGSPESLAHATALSIFSEADLNNDNRLSKEEFKRYMEASSSLQGPLSTLSNRAVHSDVITLDTAKTVTGLGELSADQLFQELAVETNSEGMIDRPSFYNLMHRISRAAGPKTSEEMSILNMVLERLFNVFAEGNQADFIELASGLSILTLNGGRVADDDSGVASMAAFQLYDLNGDGFISMEEMQTFLTSLFKLLFEFMPGTAERAGTSPEALAAATTEQCFEDADLDKDGRLSGQEFSLWFSEGGGILSGATNGAMPQQQQKSKASSPARSGNSTPTASANGSGSGPMAGLAEIKRLTKLGNLEVDEVMESIRSIAGDEPLDFQTFVSVFEQLIEMGGGHESYKDQVAASSVVRALFHYFDQDGNGLVDPRELAAGVSVLTTGSRENKVRTAFDLYDYDGDGYISLDEMIRYLTSVFKVLYAAQPETAKTFGVSAEVLGAVTAEQCFLEADKDSDGRLSFEEFQAWYEKSQ